MQSRFIAIGLTLWLLMLAGASADNEPPVRKYSNYGIQTWQGVDGLPLPSIRVIIQTRDGYLWMGTRAGLARFDGVRFTLFSAHTNSLKEDEVYSLAEDRDGGLWIGTFGGGVSLYRKGTFTTFTSDDGLPDNRAWTVTPDDDGSVWVRTVTGICRYVNGRFVRYSTADGLPSTNLGAICSAPGGGIWAKYGQQLFRFVKGRFIPDFESSRGLQGDVFNLFRSRDSVWITGSGVIRKVGAGTSATYTRSDGVPESIQMIHEDRSGTVWIASTDGLYRLEGRRFEKLNIRGNSSTPLQSLMSVTSDNEGNLWVGTQSAGLMRIRDNQLISVSHDSGLPEDGVRSVLEDRHGNIWMGTYHGLALYRDGKVSVYGEKEGLPVTSITALGEDLEGNLWIGAAGTQGSTSGKGVYIHRDGRFSMLSGMSAEPRVFTRDREGRMWVGTDRSGIFIVDRGEAVQFNTPQGLSSRSIRALYCDSKGAVWIGILEGGLCRYEGGTLTAFSTKDGLSNNSVSAVYEDRDGTYWIGTRNGLNRYKDGRFSVINVEDGLYSGFIFGIVEDDSGYLWFSCTQGLFKVKRSELNDFCDRRISGIESIAYGIKDGMRSFVCLMSTQPASWKTRDGRLLFGTTADMVIVDPERLRPNTIVPPVYVERAKINDQNVSTFQEAVISPGRGEVEIDYTALCYFMPERARFKYRLEGFDKDWVNAGARRTAYYTNLPPGSYTFRVVACNNDGVWNEAGASFSFTLKPHFYQTFAFLALILTVVLLLALAVYRLRMLTLRARYSAVLGERNRIAREIHDTLAQNLAGIAMQLDSVTMQFGDIPPKLRQHLDLAYSLTRYSLAEARSAVLDLRSHGLERRELSEALSAIAHRIVAGTSLEVRVRATGIPGSLNALVEKNLLRVVQEAISNVVKHAKAHTIDIDLEYESEGLTIRIRDDGVGFDSEKVIPLSSGHYGLIGMRERVERIGGRLTIRSRIGEGSELKVEVPVAKMTRRKQFTLPRIISRLKDRLSQVRPRAAEAPRQEKEYAKAFKDKER